MYTRLPFRPRIALSLLLLSAFLTQLSTTFAQGTAFTYQGRLNDGANSATGSYDLRFIAYDNSIGGSQQGSVLTSSATAVSNGLFTVTLDFGAIFPDGSRWLEIAVRTNGAGGFTILSPRQALTPTPYAITAGSVAPGAGLSGTYGSAITLNNAGNSFSGNGSGLTSVNAATLGGLSKSSLWQTSGNTGTVSGANFIGTTDNQPFDVRVNNVRAMRYGLNTDASGTYTNAPNVIGGSSANTVTADVIGAFIGGGGGNKSSDGSPLANKVTASFGTVCGGAFNTVGGLESFVGGGYSNNATGGGGGIATVSGGLQNTASGNGATIGGGAYNTAAGIGATVPAGQFNDATGNNSFAAGVHAKANHSGAFVWADGHFTDFASTADDQFLIRARGGVGIGLSNPAGQLHVASASGNPQIQITQNTGGDFTRLRMNVAGSQSWEMDVSGGATPSISWWNSSLRMNLDYNGNLTTSGTVNGTSDRNAKEKFTSVSSRAVLDKVAALPISEWNFKNEVTRHIGPMAQDFYAAFNVGMDDKHIATVDEGGVALAAIQGLNEKMDSENAVLRAENAELKQKVTRLEELEQRLSALEQGRAR